MATQIAQTARGHTSKPVDIPTDFLKADPADTSAIAVEKIDFSKPTLPEYTPYYATILDNVLSATECTELLQLAVESTPMDEWEQATVNSGIGKDVLAPEVRLCGRIKWDNPELVGRIWDRCILATGIEQDLRCIAGRPGVQRQTAADGGEEWVFSRLNERMSFLKYGVGQYFNSHSDGHYATPSGDEVSFYTLQVYLSGDLKGGATRFHSIDMTRLFEGAKVEEGVKYTLRTDVMYHRLSDQTANQGAN